MTIIDFEQKKIEHPQSTPSHNESTANTQPIDLDQRRREQALRKEYDDLEQQRRISTANGHHVLDGAELKRRVSAFQGTRETPVTLEHVAKELNAIRKAKGEVLDKLTTRTATGPDGQERREHDDEQYKRTQLWLRKKGYVKAT